MVDIQISIVITARNYGRYLAETIKSCLNQSVKPYDVIYSDDCSEDNSIEIAKEFDIKIIEHKEHVGVVKARNDGVNAATGNVLVHVDGDDILPEDFLERHLETFDETTPFVYGAAKTFGLFEIFWKVYTWSEVFLWDRNFVNTSAMMWKDIFLKAGGWQETCEYTMWDWSLALRMSRFGVPKSSSAVLLYRQHNDSFSFVNEKRSDEDFKRLTISLRRELVTMTIGLVYSGRLPELMDRWMKKLVEDISILSNKPELIIVNNSEQLIRFTEGYEAYFSKIKIITGRGRLYYKDEVDRRNKVCELLSDCCNLVIENSNCEIIHFREDDIIPEKGSFKQLYEFVTDEYPVNVAAAGTYLNRNIKSQRYVGGFYNIMKPGFTKDLEYMPSSKPFEVDFAGTGFLMFWKGKSPMFKPYVDGIQAHDWAWSLKLKQMGHKLFMIPKAICRHYKTSGSYIIPREKVLQ